MQCLKVVYHKRGGHKDHVCFLPIDLVSYFESKEYETTQLQAVKLALTHHLQMEVWIVSYDAKTRYHSSGDVYDSSKDLFTVNEHFNGYSVSHYSGATHWLSDGVDAMTLIVDDTEVTLRPGTLGFIERWADFLNCDAHETLAAYFSDLVEKE